MSVDFCAIIRGGLVDVNTFDSSLFPTPRERVDVPMIYSLPWNKPVTTSWLNTFSPLALDQPYQLLLILALDRQQALPRPVVLLFDPHR